MTVPAVFPAGTATVARTLTMLDREFSSFAEAVAKGRYTFWIGSGISRSRVDSLEQVLHRALTFLQSRIDPSDADSPHRIALHKAIGLAQLSPDDLAGVDTSMPPSTWPALKLILQVLVNKYSQVLDIRVTGEPEDYMLWEAVDVVATFAGAGLSAGCEHLCLAILAVEGVLPSMVTANWDGLIEAAVAELAGDTDLPLQVCVSPEDFSASPQRARLLKFHGCAIRARDDENQYRKYLIGSQWRITSWPHDSDHAVMSHEMASLAAVRSTLFLGLSGQDSDIQDTFAKAVRLSPRSWPSSPPAFVFAEDELGPMQLNILRVGYGESYGPDASNIDSSALIRVYASPLLVSLVLHVLTNKLVEYAKLATPASFLGIDADNLARGLRELRDLISTDAENDRDAFVRRLVAEMIRTMTLFQEGQAPAGLISYRPLSVTPVHQIAQDPGFRLNGLSQLAVALAVIGLGHAEGAWVISDQSGTDIERSAIRARASAGEARIYFVADANAAMRLMIGTAVDASDPDVLIVHSKPLPSTLPRAPRSPVGRTGNARMREVDMSELLASSIDLADLRAQFRAAAVM